MNILGIDVSKETLACYLASELQKKAHPKAAFEVANSEESFELIREKVEALGVPLNSVIAVLEPTGFYHLPLTEWFNDNKVEVSLVNSLLARNYAKSMGNLPKNDKIDSFVLAQFGLTHPLTKWTSPSGLVRELDDLIRTRRQIAEERIAAQNRYSERRKDMNAKCVELLKQTLEHFNLQLKAIDEAIQALINSDDDLKSQNNLLQTIPGVGPVLSSYLITLFNSHYFKDGNQVASFCGIVPREFQSGTSVHGASRMTKRGPRRLRAILWLSATSVTKTKKKSALKDFFERLVANGKSKACALGALMHKIILISFAIWRDRVPFNFNKNQNIANNQPPMPQPSSQTP